MFDLLMLVLLVACFAALAAFVHACDGLTGRSDVAGGGRP